VPGLARQAAWIIGRPLPNRHVHAAEGRVVDIGDRAWCQLAYQFGHKFGHVLSDSWAGSQTCPARQWLEEATVEAFSIHGLRCSPTAGNESALSQRCPLRQGDPGVPGQPDREIQRRASP
jgi:hypothetical protein